MDETTPQPQTPASPALPASLPGVGELLRQSWITFKQQWQIWVRISLIGIVGFAVIGAVFFGGAFAAVPQAQNHASSFTPLSLVLLIIGVVLLVALAVAMQAALIYKAANPDSSVGVKAAYRGGWQRAGAYFWTALLGGIATAIGFIIILIPGIILSVWFVFASYVSVLEGKSGPAALKQSRGYARGRFWAVLGRIAVWMLIWIIISIITGIINAVIPGSGNALNGIASIIIAPVAVIYMYLLYVAVKASYR